MKGIAIQTILMLLVGILVVGIIVYMVYMYMFAPGLTQNDCRAQLVSWCTTCRTVGWVVDGFALPANVAECTGKYFGYAVTTSAVVDCNDDVLDGSDDDCSLTTCPNTTICSAVGVGTSV